MGNRTQFGQKQASREFSIALFQCVNNLSEIHRRSRTNPKVQEMCQSISEALNSIHEWSDLPGSVMLVVAYQPNMFDEDEFARGADFDIS